MTRDELVERVARAICKAVGDEPDSDIGLPGFEKLPNWTDWTNEARAAVDIVMEEAARVADGFSQVVIIQPVQDKSSEERKAYSDGYWESADEVAAAIRALKSGESNE